ncbi:MAG: SPFH domain-containing protein [Planctomycetes bacterium]|nr:SPFH domain-containing protein [Planctomycetota bacterium]
MQEHERKVISGWVMLPLVILVWLAAPALIYAGIRYERVPWIVAGALTVPFALLFSKGLFTLQPNEARVLVLFGRYIGTVRQDGFHWANPFAVNRGPWTTVPQSDKQKVQLESQHRYRVSLRARNFETQAVKVNDQRGNPIEIGAVVVWRVEDTAKALFDVDEYENYVRVQGETAVRHLANSYPYDHAGDVPDTEVTLRGNSNDISAALEKELQERLSRAGVVVQEARLTHLAYAPEIAGTMLRRQQAEAIIAARQKIVHGAVSMVQMALTELSEKHVVDLDEERKAAMVSNLLVVLCSEQAAEPVINTGTLYH